MVAITAFSEISAKWFNIILDHDPLAAEKQHVQDSKPP